MSNDRIWEQIRTISNLFKDGKVDEGKALVADNFKVHHFLKNIPKDSGVIPLLEFLNEKYQPDWSKYVAELTYSDKNDVNYFLEFAQKHNIDLLKTDKDGFTLYEGLCERIFGYYIDIPAVSNFINLSSQKLIQSESKKTFNKEHIVYKIINTFHGCKNNEVDIIFNILEQFIEKGYDNEKEKKKVWSNIVNKTNNFTMYLSMLPLDIVQNFLSNKKDLLSEEQTNKLYSHIVLSKCVHSNPLSEQIYDLGMDLIKNNKFDLDMKNFYSPSKSDLKGKVFSSYNEDFSINTKNKKLFLEIIKTHKIPLKSLNTSNDRDGTLYGGMMGLGIECCKKAAYYATKAKMKDGLLKDLEPNEEIFKEEFLNKIKDFTVIIKDFLAAGIEPNLKNQKLEWLQKRFNNAINNKDDFYDERPLKFMFRISRDENENEVQTYDKITLSIAKDLQIPSALVAMVLDSLEKHKKLEEILPPFDEKKQKMIIEEFEAILNQSVELDQVVEKKAKVQP
jgi:hypothetical protein